MARVKKRVRDRRVLKLIDRYLKFGVLVGVTLEPTEEGVPQGGPLSPLLANLLLDDLDRELERRGHRFVRYADDLTIFVGSQRAAERVLASVSRWRADFGLGEVPSPFADLETWIHRRLRCYALKQWDRRSDRGFASSWCIV
jgi:retron-type reverse transcriptase